MVASAKKIPLAGLARKIVAHKLISEQEAQEATRKAQKRKFSLVTYLVNEKKVASADIARTASADFSIPLLDLDTVELNMRVIKEAKLYTLKKHRLVPLHKQGTFSPEPAKTLRNVPGDRSHRKWQNRLAVHRNQYPEPGRGEYIDR